MPQAPRRVHALLARRPARFDPRRGFVLRGGEVVHRARLVSDPTHRPALASGLMLSLGRTHPRQLQRLLGGGRCAAPSALDRGHGGLRYARAGADDARYVHCEATLVAIVGYSGVLFSMLLDFALFDVAPVESALRGAGLMAAALIIVRK
jgi:hypothetical protein